MPPLVEQRWFRFSLVGAAGFAVDALVLAVMHHLAEVGPLPSRAVSFTVAVIVTWQLNRRFTFAGNRVHPAFGELLRYLGSNLTGLAVNAGGYALLVILIPWAAERPVMALIPASLLAAFVNYHGSANFAFRSGNRP
jgi:putative flippase GtrA